MTSSRSKGFGDQTPFVKIEQTGYEANRQARAISDAVEALQATPLANSNMIERITFTTASGDILSGVVSVKHRLGRPYRGWFVTHQPNYGVRYVEVSGGKKDTLLLLLVENDVANPGPDDLIHKINIVVF